MKRFIQFLPALLMTTAMWAQSAQIPLDFGQLEKKASKATNVSINKSMFDLILRFLPKDDPDADKLRKVLSNLQGIYVRSFDFENEGDYSPGDLAPLRKIITGSGWNCLVSVHNKKTGEDTDFCLRQDKDKILGLAIISAEAKKLTVVNILGAITEDELEMLQGKFGVPEINLGDKSSKPKSKDKPKDDED